MSDLIPSAFITGAFFVLTIVALGAALAHYRPTASFTDGVIKAAGLLMVALAGWLMVCLWQGRADLLPPVWLFLVPGALATGICCALYFRNKDDHNNE